MKRSITVFALLVLSIGGFAMADDLKVGDAAPDFTLTGSDGKTHKLKELRGQVVVLAWFPKAFTGGWTKECQSFRENGAALSKLNVAYFTVSCDTVDLNTKFAKALELNYPILSDPTRKVAEAYGVVNAERKNPFRWTFYIGEDGKLLHIDKTVNPAQHGEAVVKKLQELGVKTK